MAPPEALLTKALQLIGKSDATRHALVRCCQAIEASLQLPFTSVREEVTGPLIDVAHRDVGVLQKHLQSGLILDFHYTSKIARDFIMSEPEVPNHVWEPQTTRLLLYLAEKARHVLIGGAYFGDQALLVAQAVKSRGGKCHAFEPHPDNARLLRHNAEINDLDNIEVHRLGLYNGENVRLKLVGEDALASSEVAGADVELAKTFPSISIDRYLQERGIPTVQLIMLDIEGGEFEALQGATKQLEMGAGQAPHLIFEIHRSFVDWSCGLPNTPILKYLTARGYKVFAVRDFHSNHDMQGRPIELIPPERTYLDGPVHGFNMVAVKEEGILKNDLFRFCADVSPKLLEHKDPALHHPMDGLIVRAPASGTAA